MSLIILKKEKSKSAFSLIELSIVIIIIGFLVGGVMAGKKLIDSAKLVSARFATKSSVVGQIEDLELWLDAASEDAFEDNEAIDGEAISTWFDINPQNDKKNNAIQNESARQPIYERSNFNDLPALNFDGTNDFISTTLGKTIGKTINSNFTVFVVFQTTVSHQIDLESDSDASGIGGQRYLFRPTHGNDFGTGYAGVGLSVGTNGIGVYEHAGGYLPALAVHEGNEASRPNVTVMQYVNNTPFLYINGTQVDTDDSHLTSPMIAVAPNVIGGSDYGYFTGQVAEVIIYSRSLSTKERNAVNSYLMSKWRIN